MHLSTANRPEDAAIRNLGLSQRPRPNGHTGLDRFAVQTSQPPPTVFGKLAAIARARLILRPVHMRSAGEDSPAEFLQRPALYGPAPPSQWGRRLHGEALWALAERAEPSS